MPKQNAVVFDDDDLFQILFKRILNTLDVEVKSFANPGLYFCSQPGVDSCPVAVPCVDFQLTDHMMSDMTGLEFLRRTRQIGCKIPDCRSGASGRPLERSGGTYSGGSVRVYPLSARKTAGCFRRSAVIPAR